VFQQPASLETVEPAATCKFMKRGGMVLNFGAWNRRGRAPPLTIRAVLWDHCAGRCGSAELIRVGRPGWTMASGKNSVRVRSFQADTVSEDMEN
jgi:hypothetical protein